MDIIKSFNDPKVNPYVYGENNVEIEYADGLVLVKNRKEKYDSLAVHTDKILGAKDAYSAQVKMKLKEGSPDTSFIIAYKYTIEYLDLNYTMYSLGKSTMVTDKDWAEFNLKLNIPTGAKIVSVISYFIQQGNLNVLPDVYVKEFIVEEAEAVKTITENRKALPLTPQKKLTFGAIRWDAYMETGLSKSFVSDQVARSLSPKQFHTMAPFFTKVIDQNKVAFPPETQEQFDKEAELAANAGIDYFAYCWYGDNNPMSYARKQHLKSPFRDKIKMCAIFGVGKLDDASMTSLGKAMAEDCYLKFDNRPVVFLYDAFRMTTDTIKKIENSAKDAGVTEPVYFVGMAGKCSPFIINEFINKGINAISAYACGYVAKTPDFDSHAACTENQNENQYSYSKNIDIIPLVSCGRNAKPRIVNPVTWAGDYTGRDTDSPTGEELYNHATRVFEKMLNEKERNIPLSAITYAWNEHDEGGWCCPTLTVDENGIPIKDENGQTVPDTTYLNALKRALSDIREKE